MRFDCTFLEASGVAALQEHLFAPVATLISALQVATLGSDLATPRTCTSAKAGCAERQYTVEQLRLAAHSILAAAKSGKPLAAAAAARLQGVPSMRRSLTRLMEQVWALDGPDRDQAGFGLDRWLVRSDYIAAYEFAVKGNDFATRRIFSEQDDALIKEGCGCSRRRTSRGSRTLSGDATVACGRCFRTPASSPRFILADSRNRNSGGARAGSARGGGARVGGARGGGARGGGARGSDIHSFVRFCWLQCAMVRSPDAFEFETDF